MEPFMALLVAIPAQKPPAIRRRQKHRVLFRGEGGSLRGGRGMAMEAVQSHRQLPDRWNGRVDRSRPCCHLKNCLLLMRESRVTQEEATQVETG